MRTVTWSLLSFRKLVMSSSFIQKRASLGVEMSIAIHRAEPTESTAIWSLTTRAAFRFALAYLSLFMLTFPPTIFQPPVRRSYIDVWNPLVAFVAKHVLHVQGEIGVFPGDTILEWTLVFSFLLLSLIIAAIWSVFDQKRKNYEVLMQASQLLIRLWLAAFLISYGTGKIFPFQFPPPPLSRYLATFGDASHMGLLWTFMGVSRAYQAFAGIVELLAGLTLLIPRLNMIGAFLTIGAMGNVLALDIGYDVHVKLFTAHLLLAAVFLLAPDIHRLLRFFVLNRTAKLRSPQAISRSGRMNAAIGVVQVLYAIYLTALMMTWCYNQAASAKQTAKATPLYGIWSVDQFELDWALHAPLTTDAVRWQRVVVESPTSVVVQMMDGTLVHGVATNDDRSHTIQMRLDASVATNFAYTIDSPSSLILNGNDRGHQLRIQMHALPTDFLLSAEGVRWVHPFPPVMK
jgi:uncharacterized membrane protein YphA (DoxX/SURF4 family)